MRRIAFAAVLGLMPVAAQAAVFYPQSFTLSNGMEIIIVQNRLSPAVAQMVWYKVGAVDDPAGHSGLAHYLEHMMFKGTKAVPAGQFSAIIAGLGGEENAFTTHDTTAYHEIVAEEHLVTVMQLEADRMRGLVLDPKEALPERDVVLSERQQRTDNSPQGLFAEKMAAALFPDHLYGRPVIGWSAEIAKITPQDATAFYHAHYAPNNAALVISGNVEVSEVLRLASATFGQILPQKIPPRPTLDKLHAVTQKRLEMQDARVKQPFVVSRYALPSAQSDLARSYALEVLAEVLSADEVGLLYRYFVMDRKIATAVDALYRSDLLGPATFSIVGTPAPNKKVRELEKQMALYLRQLAKRGVSLRDVQAAKQRMEDSAIFARDRLMVPAQIFGQAFAIGQTVQEVERWPSRIRAVTPQQVNAALRAVLANPHHVTGILEPAVEGVHP